MLKQLQQTAACRATGTEYLSLGERKLDMPDESRRCRRGRVKAVSQFFYSGFEILRTQILPFSPSCNFFAP